MLAFTRPSPALVIACLALLLAAGGGAFAAVRATGNAVNIVDPASASRIAKVSSGGGLKVSGSVTAVQAAPADLVRGFAFPTGTCATVAAPPAGKALVITSVLVDTYEDPTPGSGQFVSIYTGAPCNTLVADVNPPTVGATSIPIPTGLAIPNGQSLSAFVGGAVAAEVYAYGYTVNASAVPATGQQVGGHAGAPDQGGG
jgi:hypothetical protein